MEQLPIEFSLPEVSLVGGEVSLGGEAEPVEQALDIPYLQQPASEWCWATCATMVTRFVFQNTAAICQVVSTLIAGQNCCNGVPPEGESGSNASATFFRTPTLCNRTAKVAEILQLYDKLGIQSTHRGGKIDFDSLCDQIADAGSPIEVAFSWLGGGGHVVLVRGVIKETAIVRVNDPWPDTGEVLIPFSQLQSAYGRGTWFDSWTNMGIRQPGPANGTV
jgi:hypothetical protein